MYDEKSFIEKTKRRSKTKNDYLKRKSPDKLAMPAMAKCVYNQMDEKKKHIHACNMQEIN